jgi:hypothetical protein
MNNQDAGSSAALLTKLGYQAEHTVIAVNAPESFLQYLIENNTKLVKQLPADWLQLFCMNQEALTRYLQIHNLAEARKGMWLCWPKKSSGLQTDLSDQALRNELLPLGWVDTKVCAVDQVWSGLKFVRQVKP